jgi:hypothetical protein
VDPSGCPDQHNMNNGLPTGAGGSSTLPRERPSVALIALWTIVTFSALLFFVIAVAATGASLFGEHDAKVDPTALPAGTEVIIVDGVGGPSTRYACPPLVGSSESSPSWCEDADREALLIAVIAPAIALLAGGGTFLAGRRAWRLHRNRHAAGSASAIELETPARYVQDAMPWGFWTAVAVVGGFTVLLDVACVVAWLEAGRIAGVAGPVLWTTILVTIVVTYGRRRAYALDLDGPDLVWRAPLRTRRVPVGDIAGIEAGSKILLGERPTSLLLRDGTALPISVPNDRHAARLARFVGSVTASG